MYPAIVYPFIISIEEKKELEVVTGKSPIKGVGRRRKKSGCINRSGSVLRLSILQLQDTGFLIVLQKKHTSKFHEFI